MCHFNRISPATYSTIVVLLCAAFLHTPAHAAPTLSSITVTPSEPVISVGQSQSFAATGMFSDGSTQLLRGSPVTALGAAGNHTCLVLANGTVQCWGLNRFGELGNGTTTASINPVIVSGISTAKAVVAAGEGNTDHACALLASGAVKCWGNNVSGQLGNGTTTPLSPWGTTTPVTVSGISTATAVATGPHHTCALLASGEVQCWGSGFLGNGTRDSSNIPVTVSGINTATSIAAGGTDFDSGSDLTCVLLAGGTVQCWGAYGYSYAPTTTPVTVSGITNATAIAVGGNHACAVLSSGAVQCWGKNDFGQLGNGTTSDAYTISPPASVSGISTAIAVTAGSLHSCALLASGAVQCWGNNYYGQLGNTTTAPSLTPVTVSGISTATALAAGYGHSCALLASGAVQCWGLNGSGELGIGQTNYFTTPVDTIGISSPTALAAGGNNTCAVLAGGAVQCWGSNFYGTLGNGTNSSNSMSPVSVTGISTATALTVGDVHSCALLTGGSVKCWGYNGYGQLGNGTQGNATSSNVPVAVSGISTATVVVAGPQSGAESHSCAVLASGVVQCWGYNHWGEVGLYGQYNETVATPNTVSGISTATGVSLGAWHTCALLSSGAVQCWGAGFYGELGDGQRHETYSPVTVSGITTAKALASGSYHTCALLADGTVQCWGNGLLGNGTTDYSTIAVTVSGISTAIAVTAGSQHSCALLASGTVQCWGSNVGGQLGNGTTTNSTIPVTVSGITTAKALMGGGGHTCALLASGAVQCWGSDFSGELGNGLSGIMPMPVTVIGTPSVLLDWSSSDPSVAPITPLAKATGLSFGSTQISATAGSISGSTTLTVGHTLTLITQGNGSVTGAGVYRDGQKATVTATPNAGATFSSWSGANGAECATGSVVMDTEKSCTAVFIGKTADLSLTMTDTPDPVLVNGTLVYTMTVTNNGPKNATRVRLNDTLPSYLNASVVSIVPSKGSCWASGVVKCWLGSLSKGATASVVITVRPTVAAGLMRNNAVTWSGVFDPDSKNNKAKVSTLVQ